VETSLPAEIPLELLQGAAVVSQPVSREIDPPSACAPFDLIRSQAGFGELAPAEIQQLIAAYTRGDVPDYQMSAWLMAVVLRGMTRSEIASLTEGHAALRPRLGLFRHGPGAKWTSTPQEAWATRLRWSLLQS